MFDSKSLFRIALCLLLVPFALPAQETEEAVDLSQPPSRAEADKIFTEMVDLMEAAGMVTPELARAGAPLTENVKQAALTLKEGAARDHVGVVYKLLVNARAYVELLDSLPKPPTFSEDIRRQLDQLRRRVDRTDLYFRTLLDLREQQIRDADRDNLARYAQENARLDPPVEGEQRVVFLGDSITDGWQLNQFFGAEKPYINRGISGQITSQMLGRLQADVIELQPEAMVFLGGTNDIARGIDLEIIQDNITMIADLAAAHGIAPILASVLPVSDYHAEQDPRFRRTRERDPREIVSLNRWLRGFCENRGYRFLDYYAAVVDEKGMLPAAMADDGLHPNSEGYKVMARLAQEAIDATLNDRKRPSRRNKRFGVF